MHISEAVTALLTERNTRGLQRKKAETALIALVDVLGDVDIRCLGTTSSSTLGSLRAVPGSEDTWVVVGEHKDGTVDLMCEGGTSIHDTMLGWTPGETEAQYREGLVRDFMATIPELKKVPPVKPLFVSAANGVERDPTSAPPRRKATGFRPAR